MPSQLAEYQAPASLPKGRGKGPGGLPDGLLSRSGRCPVPGCGEAIDGSRLMCRRDWNLAPKQLRDQVWSTWRSGMEPPAASTEKQSSRRSPPVARPDGSVRPGTGLHRDLSAAPAQRGQTLTDGDP
jgi:hypothetical protein